MADIYGFLGADGELRYIGKANDPAERLKKHMGEIGRRRTPLYNWLLKHGEPTMIVLEANCDDWKASERAWIAEARLAGVPLLNLADGGDEPLCTREQRQANARKTNANGYGLTSDRARAMARKTNEMLRNDPRRQKIKRLKSDIGAYAHRYGITPRILANMFYAAWRDRKTFGRWFERLADKHDAQIRAFTNSQWDIFHARIAEIADGTSKPQNA